MSNQIPDFLKNFIDIKNILSDETNKQKFISKFKSILKITDKDKEDILKKLEQLGDIQINSYFNFNEEFNDYNIKYSDCYEQMLKPNTNIDSLINNPNNVYYNLKNRDNFESFCDKKYSDSLENKYIWFNDNKVYFFDSENLFYENIGDYSTDKNKIKLLNNQMKNNEDNEFNKLKSKNFDDYYYYLIDKNYKINLSTYVKFLIKLIDYENKPDKEEEILKSFNEVRDGFTDKYIETPFEEAKETKLEKLKNKTKINNLNFNPEINIEKNDIKVNNPNIFDSINIKLNLKDSYKNEINKLNNELREFYSNENYNLDDKLNLFISILNDSYRLIEKFNSNYQIYICKILSNIIIKLPLEILSNISTENELKDLNLVIQIYKNFSTWINICKSNKTINIYKYAYLLLINHLLFDKNEFFEKEIIIDNKLILEEFMIDINLSTLYSYELFEDIQKIKTKLTKIRLWYNNKESYLSILQLLEKFLKEEKTTKFNNTIQKELESDKILKIKKNYQDNSILTTKDLAESNNVFSKASCSDLNIEMNYFKNNLLSSKSGDLGILNNPEKILIDTSSLIFKFIDLDSINTLSNSNILLMWIQMINCVKITNYSNFEFPYQFPITTKCELTISRLEENKIMYEGIFDIKEKNIENNYTLISNKLNTLNTNTNSNNKNAYIDYFFNYISTENPLYLNKIINPFVKYGFELDEDNFEPIDYSNIKDTDNKYYLSSSNFKSKDNFFNLINNLSNTNEVNFSNLNELNKTQFNNLFYIFSSIKENSVIKNFILDYKNLFEKNMIQDDDIEEIKNSNYSMEMKLIYITNAIKYHYSILSETNTKSYEILYKLLELVNKLSLEIFNQDKNPNNEEYKLICHAESIKLEYLNYEIPYLELTNDNKIKGLNDMIKLKRFNGKIFSQFVDLTFPNKDFKDDGVKKNAPDSYKIHGLEQFDNSLKLFNPSYKNNRIRNSFYIKDKQFLYPKKTKEISNKNFGFFVGNDDTKEYFNYSDEYDCVDISEFRPKVDNIKLSQMMKINPNINNVSFREMFKYIILLYKLIGNKNINLKCMPKLSDVNAIDDEPKSFLLPVLDKFDGTITDLNNIDFANGHFKFVVEQIENDNNLYYSPPFQDVIFEYVIGTEIRFEVKDGKCVKYYIDEVIRYPDPWMNDFYSLCVQLCRETNSIVRLDELKTLNSSNMQKSVEQNPKPNSNQNSNVEINDRNLDEFFIFSIKELELLLPKFSYSINEKNTNKTNTNENETLKEVIINSMFEYISKTEILFDANQDIIFTNAQCGTNTIEQVYTSYDYEQIIYKVYMTKNILKQTDREIYICGKDLFKLYTEDELINIYNKSPNIASMILKSKDGYSSTDLKKINIIEKSFETEEKNIGWKYEFNSKSFYSIDNLKDKIFKGLIDSSGNIKFSFPYYLDNPVFYNDKYFQLIQESDKILLKATKNNTLYSKNTIELDSIFGIIKLYSDNESSDENKVKIYLSLFKLSNQANETNNFLNKLINAFGKEKSNILCWTSSSNSSNQTISNIDLINLGLRFDIEQNKIILSNMYEIILDYSNVDWRIKRWVYVDKKEKGEYNWNTDKNRIFLAKNKNNYFMIIFFVTNYTIIKIDSNTFLPIFNNLNPKLLIQIIQFYAYDFEIISDLLPLIVKNNLDKFIYGTIVSELKSDYETNKLNEVGMLKYNSNFEMTKFIDKYTSINNMCDKKTNYYLNYEYININESNFEYYDNIFYQQFYFKDNQLNSLGEFILYSLTNKKPESQITIYQSEKKINMNIFIFNYLYYKLKNKIYLEFGIDDSMDETKIKEILDENEISILEPNKNSTDGKKYFKNVNPLEFYYQYIFGYFARDVQLSMANDIFRDLTGYSINENTNDDISSNVNLDTNNNFRLRKFIQIKSECFVENTNKPNPNIYNLIMGAGKTSMITPLVMIKYLQLMTTDLMNSKSNFYLVLPEKLVNPSVDKLTSLFSLYFPINIRKCIETRENVKQEQKYNLTYLETLGESNSKLDPYNLNVFVLSDTSLKSGFINDYNKVLDSNIKSNNVYLFDEIDTIINPLTSELNYPLSLTTKSVDRIELLFDLMYKIYLNIYNDGSDSFKDILHKYPTQFKSNPFTIINATNGNFISELKCWVRSTLSKHLKKNYKKISEIISKGFVKNYQEQINSMDIWELNFIYSINNFIDTIFIQSLMLVNRVDYGTNFYSSIDKNVQSINLLENKQDDEICKILNNIKNHFSHQVIKLPMCKNEPIIQEFNQELKEILSEENTATKIQTKSENKNTDLVDDVNLSKYLIIPFSNNEDPVIGSKFSSPLMTLALTIINYITRTGYSNIIDDKGIKEIAEIIYENYINSTNENKNKINEEFKKIFNPFEPKFVITEIVDKCNYFSEKEILAIKSNAYFIYLFCQKVCVQSLKVDMIRFNVSGMDLMESHNISNRTGFSGTVGIPKPIDSNEKKQLEIKPDQTTIKNIEEVLKNCEIKIYDSKSNLLDELIQLINSPKSENETINTIIDCGGVFVNITPYEIWEKLKSIDSNKMYFWNDNDRPEEFIKTSPYSFETNLPDSYLPINTNNKVFYYYDQKHTTGIDAKIPLGSIGLVFLNKSSRYRDVVQSMFRMRKLKNEQHKIIFCLANNIKQNISKNDNDLDIKELINWFKNNEKNYFIEQEISGNIQNVNTIERVIKSSDNKYLKSDNKSCVLLSNNYYREIGNKEMNEVKEIVEGKQNWITLDLMKQIEIINSNIFKFKNNSNITTLIENINSQINQTNIMNDISALSQSKSQTQTQTQTQTLTQTLTKEQINELENINEDINIYASTLMGVKFKLEDYFKYNESQFYFYNKQDLIYLSSNINFYKNELFPSTVIYLIEEKEEKEENKILIIPNLEGYKLIDWLSNTDNSSLNLPKYLIFDSTGTFYLTNVDDIKDKEQIQSFIRIMLSVETNRNIISNNDKENFEKFLSPETKSSDFIKKCIDYLTSSEKNYLKKFVKDLKYIK